MNGLYLSKAVAQCNDAKANTWEVRAPDGYGKMWTVSDSSQMTEPDAEELAREFRDGKHDDDRVDPLD